ncbi:Rgg/GadR/MutR family transcriptional regulator [Lactococcus muris]|uniref:Rgg/GadR/MutR family transcriptional regulator n=1 Tax=Lactococcus muris TaxID=2941330 RepID=A0ABV4DF88_9LACT
MYKKYGDCFRKFRNQKNLGLSYFSKLGVNRANLSRFERGQSMMSFERVELMLEEMQVPLAEYELIVNNFTPNFQEIFLLELEEADFSQDIDKIQSLYTESQREGKYLLSLAAKTRLKNISLSEVKEVEDYLCNVEEWGYFELTLFYFVSDYMDISQLESLLADFDERCEKYCRLLKYRRRLFQIAYHSAAIFASNGEREKAENILEITKKYRGMGVDLYVEVLRHLAMGIIIFNFEDKDLGDKQINYALDVLENFGGLKLKKFYQRNLKKFKRN